MNVHKTKIEWCSHTWNPVTGCRHGCEYCYAQRIVSRFEPKIDEWPDEAITTAPSADGVPVFMKDSLKAVWGDDLIREYPSGMDGGLNG